MPGIDPANVHGALGAGPAHADRKGIAQAQLLGDREGRHVTQLGVPIQLGARSGQHSGQQLHVFHGAEQVAEVLVVGLETADVNVGDVRELLGHGGHRVHVAEGRAEDQVEALAGQAAEDLLGIGAFGYVLDILAHHLAVEQQAFIVCLRPAAVVMRANQDHGHIELARLDIGDLKTAHGFRLGAAGRGDQHKGHGQQNKVQEGLTHFLLLLFGFLG